MTQRERLTPNVFTDMHLGGYMRIVQCARAPGARYLALLLLIVAPLEGHAALCARGSDTPQTRTISSILPSDKVVAPWSNETPRVLRSAQRVDGLQAMRVDLVNWPPVAFDDYGASQVSENTPIQLRLRASIDAPPLTNSLGGGATCELGQFVDLKAHRWTHLRIPLKALGRDGPGATGRIRLKSRTPEDSSVPAAGAPPMNSLADWAFDPGVQGDIAAHVPSTSVTVRANGRDNRDDSAAFARALASINTGGVINVPAGTFYLSSGLSLSDSQVLRGASPQETRLIFTRSLPFGIGMEGQYPQTVRIRSNKQTARSTILQLASPLHAAFGSASLASPFTAVEHVGLERLTLDVADQSVRLGDMILMRSASKAWVRDVVSRRAFAAHVFTRQPTQCEIRDSVFIDATGQHDGKQGFGIDLANSTSNCLVEGNTLSRLRHSQRSAGPATSNFTSC